MDGIAIIAVAYSRGFETSLRVAAAPAPTATAPIPAPMPAPSPAAAPRPTNAPNNRSVGKVAAAIDLLALAASLAGAVILALELFSRSKG